MKQSETRINGTLYSVAETISTGLTSIVYKTTDGKVVKQYRPGRSINQLEREVFWLGRLRGIEGVPEVFAVDRSARAILMSDCGEPISTRNAPKDWETQLKELMKKLHANRCIHSDLSEHEVLVKDGRLCIVDFAFALERECDAISSIIKSGKKTRCFLDDYIVDYIQFKLHGGPLGSEPHCFVLWDASEHETVQAELSSRFDLLRGIVHMPNTFGQIGADRDEILTKFYCGRPSSHGKKGLSPFILYFVLDKEPRYEIRTNASRGTRGLVNVNAFDLKTRLRAGRSGFLHGSDSIQECFDNLEALTNYAENVPKSYWLCWRPAFASVAEFFERLDRIEGLEYVVMRNFDGLLRNKLDQSPDIDILVNDYYLFKRVTGAIGYKHKRSIRPGPAHEYGGYKVSGYVSIDGQETSIDIRFVGDGYYCVRWERTMLAKRIRHGGIFIPDTENLFYSLLYHALVHKPSVSEEYRRTLGEMAPAVGIDCRVVESDEQLWDCLDEFMVRQNYTYDRPKELSIPLSAGGRMRMGITTANEMRTAEDFAKRGQLLEAIDLLRGILLDEPDAPKAKRLLKSAQKRLRGSGRRGSLVRLVRMTRLAKIMPEAVKHPIRRLISAN